ncbi:MAG: hypothetical protein N2447_07455 [Thermoanaerobaculum sp.]|nr:hypothetical protein [Thermoanaerobaculum sp.]
MAHQTGGGADLHKVRRYLRAAVRAAKCHPCGCFHEAVEELEREFGHVGEVEELLAQAKEHLKPKTYDCLGCSVCWPALAVSRASAVPPRLPVAARADGPAGSGSAEGWPPLPGTYWVLHWRAPVALCTLHSETLAEKLWRLRPPGLAIVGTLHTENLGIERLILNVQSNPHIRFLILCGEDSRQVVGHLPGQSLVSLMANGVDSEGRIVGAQGRRPFLKNLS